MGSADQSGCHRGSRRGVGWNRLMILRGSNSPTCSAGDVPEQWLFSVSATPTPLLDLARSIINASLAGMRTCVRIRLKTYSHQSLSPSRRPAPIDLSYRRGRALVRAAFLAAEERPAAPLVRAAFWAAARRACFESAPRDAVLCCSRLRTRGRRRGFRLPCPAW